MKFLLLVISTFFFISAFGQTYTVLYERQYWDYTYNMLVRHSFDDELTVKDSVAYCYPYFSKNESKLPLGSEFRIHSTYFDLRHNTKIWQSQPYGGKKLLIIDSISQLDWNLFDDTLTKQGYLCRRATCIKNNQLIIAWYAPALPCKFGPDGFGGLPGLILEIGYAGTTSRTTALKIDFTAKPIIIPSKGKPLTPTDLHKYLKRNKPQPYRIIIPKMVES
jgi:GLPGLI family protein